MLNKLLRLYAREGILIVNRVRNMRHNVVERLHESILVLENSHVMVLQNAILCLPDSPIRWLKADDVRGCDISLRLQQVEDEEPATSILHADEQAILIFSSRIRANFIQKEAAMPTIMHILMDFPPVPLSLLILM